MTIFNKSAMAALAFFSLVGHAQASVVSFTLGTSLAGSLMENFNELPLGSTDTTLALPDINSVLTLDNNSSIIQGTNGNNASPFNNNVNSPDMSQYVSVYANGVATFTFSKPESYFGLQWGSVDTYNTLSFYNGNTLLGSFGGQSIITAGNLIAGNQGAFGTVYANFFSTESFNKVVATSSINSFEFDNVSVSSVPLPASLPMYTAAFMIMGAAGMYSRKARAVIS